MTIQRRLTNALSRAVRDAALQILFILVETGELTMGPLEAAVMQCVWAATEPQSVRQVQAQISTERSFAYTTVMTVMDNLHSKGLLARVRDGRAYLYSSKQTREEYTASILGDVLAEGGDRRGVLMHFVDSLDEDALTSLRQVLQDAPGEDGFRS